MFVVMALVTTVATTPLTKALYPPWYQKKVERWRRGEIDWDGNEIDDPPSSRGESTPKLDGTQIRRLMVYLRLDSLPGLFTFLTLLQPEKEARAPVVEATVEPPPEDGPVQKNGTPLEVHGLRIIELTDRTSSVMHVTEGEEFYSQRDPVVNAFRAFSQLHDLAVAGRVAVVPEDSYADTLVTQASEISSDFALIPWGEYGSVTEDQSVPFTINATERFKGPTHLEFVHEALRKARSICNTGVFIDNGFGGITKPTGQTELARTASSVSIRSFRGRAARPVADKSHHIFFPFIGGADDRAALKIVLQLAKNPHVTVSVVHINWPVEGEEAEGGRQGSEMAATQARNDKREVERDITAQDLALLSLLQGSLPRGLSGRVVFSEVSVPPNAVLTETVALAKKLVGQTPRNAGDMVVLGRRHARLGDSMAAEVLSGLPDLRSAVGKMTEQLVAASVKASILVIQAGGRSLEV